MIDGYVVGDKEVVARFNKRSEALSRELRIGIGRLTKKLQRSVRESKLAGQVLKRKTGRLALSVHEDVHDEGGKIVGVVSTNLFYGIGWETGWAQSAGASAMSSAKAKFKPKGTADTFGNGTPRKRAFLVPTLEEFESAGTIRQELEAAADRAMA